MLVMRKDSDLRVNHMSFLFFLTPNASHLTTYDGRCAMLHAFSRDTSHDYRGRICQRLHLLKI